MDEFDPARDIRILRRPTIYLRGRQTVDEEELDPFLADPGPCWQTKVEIRWLAVQVLQVMQQEAPHLFKDRELTSLPDGTFEATTKHRKV